MKLIWYHIVKAYIRLGLFFYYNKITIKGTENIPKNGATLFVGNHQNALIDPLLIATTNNRNTHFLTRAGVFKRKLIIKFFDSVQMIPIYRVRDGWSTLSKNEAIFKKCIEILNTQKSLLIFPEGSHNLVKKLRPLSKGFTRIIFGALKKYPDLKINIVPVGLNYNDTTEYPSSASIYYGKPILANDFWDKNDIHKSTNNLKAVVFDGMKVLTTHIEKIGDEYETVFNKLSQENVDFLNPIDTNKIISNIGLIENVVKENKSSKNIFSYLTILNGLIPWFVWKKLQTGISEIEFMSSIRFGIGITLFPIFFFIQALIINHFFNLKIATLYFIISLVLGLLSSKLSKK